MPGCRWLILAMLAAACSPARPEGDCLFWADCGEGGACEYTARLEGEDARFDCSFADDACPSGRRFGELASAARADRCVEFAPGFSGICDDGHPCDAGFDCELGRCNPVAELDATAEAFAARCSARGRAGGDVYLWGFVLGVTDQAISIGVFSDAEPLTADNAAKDPPVVPLDSTEMSIGANHLCTTGTTASVPYSICAGRDLAPALGVDAAGMPTGSGPNPLGIHRILAAGVEHTCGLRDSATIDCWGVNTDRQVDGAASSSPRQASFSLQHRVSSISAGSNFTCAGTAGGVYCWGGAARWASSTFANPDGSIQPVQGIPASPTSAVAAGEGHACAIVDGQVWCFGANDTGQVTGEPTIAPQPPAQPLGTTLVISIATGRLHTCAVTAAHEVMCWGDNGVGQLGSATTSHAPQVVPLEARATGPLALSDDASCAALEDALVHCWGTPELTTAYVPPLDRVALCLQ